MRRAALLTSLAFLAAAGPAAAAQTKFTIRGAGFGHGIGLSQYGAYGYAAHGSNYRDIVLHYYKGTTLSNAGGRTIRVLLQSGKSTVWVTGASRGGDRRLDPAKRYRVTRDGFSTVTLRSASGKKIETYTAPLSISSGSGAVLQGRAENGLTSGRYRGSIEVRPGLFSGLTAVNALPLDDYIQGVVPGEVPTSWPMETLKAQSVVARSYSLVTDRGGAIFDQYADTRSQMYYGMSRETSATNAAVRATSGQVVKYDGRVAVTYYFSTSGGRTENIENSFIGSNPVPYLKSVDDPYDNASPKHRWRFSWTRSQLDAKLGSWVKGTLRSVKVTQRGVSPRIVRASVVGSRGSTGVTGPQIRARLGLWDTWASFVAIKSGQTSTPPPASDTELAPEGTAEGGATASTAWMRRLHEPAHRQLAVEGTVSPKPKRVLLQRHTRKGWKTIGQGRTDRRGRYALLVPAADRYRVTASGAAGPVVAVR
jgi:stage II sporulation protein D